MRTLCLLVASGILVSAGCDQDGILPIDGELGNGAFNYSCVDEENDPVCATEEDSVSFPEDLAVMGSFELHYRFENSEINAGVKIKPASTQMIQAVDSSGSLRMLDTGPAAVLAMNPSGQVIDFIHIQGHTLGAIKMTRREKSPDIFDDDEYVWTELIGPLVLDHDEQVTLQAFALSVNNASLAGTLEYHWSCTNEQVAKLSPINTTSVVELLAAGQGTTTCVAQVDQIAFEIEVRVGGGQ